MNFTNDGYRINSCMIDIEKLLNKKHSHTDKKQFQDDECL